ncbi:MAG TPA: hypothetical protein VGZ89_04765, partial [Xanthobacteraceae bacterium]|nr:hypothetical protein [Xanthobacteraceae bacterium]
MPLDDRIELAAKAAPFVHARPEPIRKKRTDPLDLRDRLGESGDLKFGKVEAKPDPAKAAVNGDAGQGADAGGGENGDPGGGQGLSPVDFLLGVMNDSTADPEQRVKAAAVAARYKHPYA